VAKALSHPARIGILRKLGEVGQASPSAVAADASESLPTLAYHMRELRTVGLIRPSGTRPARGAVEHFYVLTQEGEAAVQAIDAVLELDPSNSSRG
jgi:DNA-binding transcriptional ArsR family regulator